MPTATQRSELRDLPFMGVIRVNNAAARVGFRMGDPAWANLGQGQPEVGEMPGAPPRINTIDLEPEDHAYGPVEGTIELRQAVADHYNRLYRADKSSKYTAQNVAISSGGRLALSRIGAALPRMRLGYFTPDYTAYEDLLTTFDRVEPIHVMLHEQDGFEIDPERIEGLIAGNALNALLISNPCNPTGVCIRGDALEAWVSMSRGNPPCMLLMDEFYSHFIYDTADPGPVSAARYVEDVDSDPVLIVDGLTKCFRYPGWRVGWVVAPKHLIHTLTAAGSFLDGGPGRPIQRAAMQVLEPARADQETKALRKHFAMKRDMTVEKLSCVGIEFPAFPASTFYAFGSIARLPQHLRDGESFMHEAFKHKVLTVPGEYFDVNPNRARRGRSPYRSFVRFSFGPPVHVLEGGLDRLVCMIGG